MSIILRGLLCITIIIIGLLLFLYQSIKKQKEEKNCFYFLTYLSYTFPLIDTGIQRFDILFSPINVLTIIFILFNFRVIKYIFYKKFIIVSLFIIIITISALLSDYTKNSLLSTYTYINPIFLFIISLKAIKYKGLNEFLNRIIKPICWWIIFFAIIQIFIDINFSFLASHKTTEDRLCYCFIDPQTAGVVCAMICIYFTNKLFNGIGKNNVIYVIIFFILTVLTGSKSSMLGLLIGFLVSIMYTKIKPVYIFSILVLSIGVVSTYESWSKLTIYKRFVEFDSSLNSREDIYWAKGILVFNENKIIGIGPGNFQRYNMEHNLGLIHNNNGEIIYASQPESGYLLLLDELGIFGLYIFIPIIFLIQFKKNLNYNISIIIPWLISFISLYNLLYKNVSFILIIMIASIYCSRK